MYHFDFEFSVWFSEFATSGSDEIIRFKTYRLNILINYKNIRSPPINKKYDTVSYKSVCLFSLYICRR